jgi:Protein of unknown function (DUF732)
MEPHVIVGPLFATFLSLAQLACATASADPDTPGTPGYCGAHTDSLDCVRDASPPSPAEQQFLNTVGPHFPNVSSSQLVQFARGTCAMLRGGATTSFVVTDLASHMGTAKEAAGQVLDAAMGADCPNLHVGADGVAR